MNDSKICKMKMIFLFFCFSALNAFSQLDSVYIDGQFVYRKVIEFEGKTKDEIYEDLKVKVIKIHTASLSKRFDYENKEEGVIYLKSSIDAAPYKTMGMVLDHSGVFNYDIEIECKDGKARFTFSNIIHTTTTDFARGPSRYESPIPEGWASAKAKMNVKNWVKMKIKFKEDLEATTKALTKAKSIDDDF